MLFAITAFGARAAHADDDATTQVARERFKEGVQFFDLKQFDKARAAFLQAYALKRHPAVLLNLAQSELRSGHEAEAAKHFSQFLREAKEATEAERQGADGGLNAAKAVVAEVSVIVDEDGATVSTGGNPEGQSPLPGPVYLTPGPQTITAKKDGREVSVQINAVAGQTSSTNLRFKRAAPAAEPEATQEKPEHPRKPVAEPPPSETPGIESEPHESAGARRRLPFFEWAAKSPFAWLGGGLTALGIGGGIGFAFGAKHSYDNADSVASQIRTAALGDHLSPTGICLPGTLATLQPPPPHDANQYRAACQKYQDNVTNGDSFKTASIVSLIVAGGAAVGTVLIYAIDGTAPAESARAATQKPQATIGPWVTGTERGVFVVGSF